MRRKKKTFCIYSKRWVSELKIQDERMNNNSTLFFPNQPSFSQTLNSPIGLRDYVPMVVAQMKSSRIAPVPQGLTTPPPTPMKPTSSPVNQKCSKINYVDEISSPLLTNKEALLPRPCPPVTQKLVRIYTQLPRCQIFSENMQ